MNLKNFKSKVVSIFIMLCLVASAYANEDTCLEVIQPVEQVQETGEINTILVPVLTCIA